ncbi:MAG: chromate efflux transporter [Candidatus Eremiobacteraeota bacterium]|nr:chromate efflux transporter [Candidatus Eremiobacteraeota bacterium]
MKRNARASVEVLWRFLRLGLTAFGGPIAHLGYFRSEFVDRARWLDDATFAEIVALCSALPGPTSSQTAVVIGTRRAGLLGGVAAWLGFTTPSAVLLGAFGIALRSGGIPLTGGAPLVPGAFGGLGAAAGGVVAQAVVVLARSLTRTTATRAIALVAFFIALAVNRWSPQFAWLPLLVGAALGVVAVRTEIGVAPAALNLHIPRLAGIVSPVVLIALLVALPVFAPAGSALALFALFFRAGSLVFGGGHVVLPLLQSLITRDQVSAATFLAGYGAAQAVPGPLFTFASFLGAVNATPVHGTGGAFVATVAIFLPSFLLLGSLLPLWSTLRAAPRASAALAGVNAAVVGLLAAVLVTPIGATLAATPWKLAVALAAFVALLAFRIPPWLVVLGCATAGAALTATLSRVYSP